MTPQDLTPCVFTKFRSITTSREDYELDWSIYDGRKITWFHPKPLKLGNFMTLITASAILRNGNEK